MPPPTPGDPFATLDPALPLGLLPVRIEARYLPRGKPTHLHVRVFPDLIHANAHRSWLSSREASAGTTFWTKIWGVSDATIVHEARRWLAAQVGPQRALWVATTLRPTNLGDAATEGAVPIFPAAQIEERTEPVRAALLPDAWQFRLYDLALSLVHTAYGTPIAADLALAPTLSAAGARATHPTTGEALSAPLAFLAGQDLLWTVDFDQAEAVGMAVRIPIARVPDPVGLLLVLGVRADRSPDDEAALLEAQLATHWYTHGLDFVPQGTPTNNTDAGRAGVSLSAPDIDRLFELEGSTRPLAPAGRALLLAADPALLYRLPAADAASLAFGRVRSNPLDKLSFAECGDGAAAWAMNLAIGYATLAAYLNGPFAKVDGSVATGEDTAALRDWYADWVRGGATLPVLRCGEQPYAVHPITHRAVEDPNATAFEPRYQHYASRFLSAFQAALPVNALDPEASDARPAGTPRGDAAIVAGVLGAVPHPTSLQLRAAVDHCAADSALFAEKIAWLEETLAFDNTLFIGFQTNGIDSDVNAYWKTRKPMIVGDPAAHPPVMPAGITDQLRQLDLFREDVERAAAAPDQDHMVATKGMLLQTIDQLRSLLVVHQAASAAVPDPWNDWNDSAGVSSTGVIHLVGTTFAEEVTAVHDLVAKQGDLTGLRELLVNAVASLDAAVANATPPAQRERLVDGAAPLLCHLIDINCRSVPVPEIGPVRFALVVLRALVDSAAPEAVFERLLRESLGLSIYRLDAWVSALAAKRLAEKRRARAAGIQLGGYGWLLDLEKSKDPVSQGFIHAPSLPHAASAAVLRSGWSAYGTTRGTTPLSVNLQSDNARGAHALLDAVRNGQDLAEALGARFERYLHAAHLDEWIETVRLAALAARGSARPPNAIVDGLLVARAASEVSPTTAEAALRSALESATAMTGDPAQNRPRRAVRSALQRIANDLDAVADLTMAQSVHSLLQDKTEVAAAALAVTGGGDGAVPPIDVTATQRDVISIQHRVITIWSGAPTATATPTTASAPLRAAEPRLFEWLESSLPAPSCVFAGVTFTAAKPRAVTFELVSLAQLGIGIVEAAQLAGAAPSQRRSRLGRAIAGAVETLRGRDGEIRIDFAPSTLPDAHSIHVDELGLVAAALRSALGRARPLRAADLVRPEVDVSTVVLDAAELGERVAATEQALRGLTGMLRGDARARAIGLVQAASIGVRGAVPALEAGATDAAIAPVVAALEARLLPPSAAAADPAGAALERLRALSGAQLPLLPVFTPVTDTDRLASAGSAARQAQVAEFGHGWLRQSARVHPDLGAMLDALILAEAAADRPITPYGLVQLPHTGGPWAAVDRPAGDSERLSIVSLNGVEPLAHEGEPVAGLMIDSWSEGIPRGTYQTGVAVHFDAPTARAPQAILLSVVDDARGFSSDEIADQLVHTIELAKVRAVDPGALPSLGQFLPAVFLPDDVRVSESDARAEGGRA